MHIVYINKENNNILKILQNITVEKLSVYKNISAAIKASKYLKFNLIFISFEIIKEHPDQFYHLRKAQPEADIFLITQCENPYAGLIKNCKFDFIGINANEEVLKTIIKNNNGRFPYKKNIYIQTIPSFKVFVNDIEVVFRGKKTRELLALLVDSNGNPLDKTQIIKAMWSDKEIKSDNVIKTTYNRLKHDLKQYHIENLIETKGTLRYINKELYNSDISEILDNMKGIEKYNGKYLEEYPQWNNYTKQILKQIKSFS